MTNEDDDKKALKDAGVEHGDGKPHPAHPGKPGGGPQTFDESGGQPPPPAPPPPTPPGVGGG